MRGQVVFRDQPFAEGIQVPGCQADHLPLFVQALHGFDDDDPGDDQDGGRVGLGGEDRRTVVAERALGIGRPPGQPHGQQREQYRAHIGDGVAGRREQAQRVGDETGHDEGRRQRQVEPQHKPEAELAGHNHQGYGRYQPNSRKRGSSMPKWWATSWMTVRRTWSMTSSSLLEMAQIVRRYMEMRSGMVPE